MKIIFDDEEVETKVKKYMEDWEFELERDTREIQDYNDFFSRCPCSKKCASSESDHTDYRYRNYSWIWSRKSQKRAAERIDVDETGKISGLF